MDGSSHRYDDADECRRERDDFRGNNLDPQLWASEVRVLEANLNLLISRARRGQLVFHGKYPDAKAISSSGFLYELRPRMRSSFPDRPRREVRLYCAEPDKVPAQILGLCLDTKPRGQADDDDEQQDAIERAENRADSWEMNRVRG